MRSFSSSARSRGVESFKVMDVLKRANELEMAGRRVLHLEVGQPSTGAPRSAAAAAQRALESGESLGYTSANGLWSLRNRISSWYRERHGSVVDPDRILVTTGSSAGFVLAFTALFDAGDAVGVPSTSYPCYRNVLRALDCEPVSISSNPRLASGFGFPGPEQISQAVRERERLGLSPLKGLILSSPANPTGSTLHADELKELAEACREHGVQFISDEIYHHICSNPSPSAVDMDGVVVVNSFSKYFSMTGWRVGWLVLPSQQEDIAKSFLNLQQNCFINAPTISQIAAEASFDDTDELDDHVSRYVKNRGVILDALERRLGIDIGAHCAPATGAFYCYVDLEKYLGSDSGGTAQWCSRLLEETGVAVTPGLDFEFDPVVGNRRVRFSYCGRTEDVVEAMDKLCAWWAR